MYVLYRIALFPLTVSWVGGAAIGVVLAVTAMVAVYGIVSEKGNSVESALLFAYIVYCLYFTFADFRSASSSELESSAESMSASSFLYFLTASTQADLPQVPTVLIHGYASIAKLVPAGFKTVFQFLQGAVSTVTPSVFISLSYRLGVFFAATRIMPAVHEVSHSRKNSVIGLNDLPLQLDLAAATAESEKEMQMALDEDDIEYNYDYKYKYKYNREYNYDYDYDSHNSSSASSSEDEDGDTAVFEHDVELDTALLDHKLTLYAAGTDYSFPPSAETLSAAYTPLSPPLPPLQKVPSRVSQFKSRSRFKTLQFLIFAYAPCILIAVYTHLLMQHLLLFNPSATTTSAGANFAWPWLTSSPRASWQFWGWVNMFTTLGLYSLELVYGQTVNREEVIDYHWNLI